MSVTESPSDDFESVELGKVADEFLERLRAGETVEIEDYAAHYPALADDLRLILPTLLTVEHAGDDEVSDSSKADEKMPRKLGDFRVLREIGRGGMGIVYEAEQESLGRRVALKVLPHQALVDAKQLERFHREAKAVGQLHHSNIVPVYAVGHDDGMHYYTMQYIHGLGLDMVLEELRRTQDSTPQHRHASNRQRQRNDAPSFRAVKVESHASSQSPGLSSSVSLTIDSSAHSTEQLYARNVARLGQQIADALAYSHSLGILHRDVKPSNLLLDCDGKLWLTDFGLAKMNDDELTLTGDLLGTLRYMPPERLKGWSDPRSDLYSLGLTLYEMLTLRPAFSGTDRAEIVRRITFDDPVAPTRIDASIPRDLETIVLKAINKEPSLRYHSAADLAQDLGRFVANKPIVARRTPLRERVQMWSRRNPLSAFLMTAVVVLLTLLATVSTIAAIRFEHHLTRARQAETEVIRWGSLAKVQLFESHLALARGGRSQSNPGLRRQRLDAIHAAAKMYSELTFEQDRRLEMRNEAIACLAAFDLQQFAHWKCDDEGFRDRHPRWACDHQIQRYARENNQGEICIIDLVSNQQLLQLSGILPAQERAARSYLDFSPDGNLLAAYAVAKDGQAFVQVYDLNRQIPVFEELIKSTGKAHWHQIAFSPNSESFAYFDESAYLCVRSLKDDNVRKISVKERGVYLCFSPDGRYLVFDEGYRNAVVLDLESEREIIRFAHPDEVAAVSWSPDGTLLATACNDTNAYVWSLNQNDRPVSICRGHTGAVRHIAFGPDSLVATTSWDQTTRIWSGMDGTELLQVKSFGRVNFSSDGTRFAITSAGNQVAAYEVVGLESCRVLAGANSFQRSAIKSLSFNPQGDQLASASRFGGFSIWQVATGKRRFNDVVSGQCRSVAFLPEAGEIITTRDQFLERRIFRSNSSESIAMLSVQKIHESQAPIDFSISQNRKTALISPVGLGYAFVVDLPEGHVRYELRDDDWINSPAMSPDGRWSAYGSWNRGHWCVWDNTTGECVIRRELNETSCGVRFSPDGKWLLVCEADAIAFCQVGSWQEAFRIARQDQGYANAVFSNDMHLLAVSEMFYVRLIDFQSRSEIAQLHGPRGLQLSTNNPAAAAMQFSPDARYLAVGSYQDTILLWDLQRLQEQLRELTLDW